MNDWRIYERFVAKLISEEHAGNDFTVIPNAKIRGSISEVERQIDVLIDAKWDENTTRRVIVDAKRYKRKINVKDVESFEGMMRDCRSRYGIIICPEGYTPAAERRAQDFITIKLVPLSELDKFTFDVWEYCLGKCTTSSRKKSGDGLVLYDSPYGLAIGESPLSIMAVGKCDVCSEFHVWCWDCGKKFALKDEDEFKCYCDNRFWLTAVEDEIDDDNQEVKSIYLLLILSLVIENAVIAPITLHVDRRRLN